MQAGNCSSSNAAGKSGDSAKLISLLTLAAGAVALPQSGNADIIYTDISSNPGRVGFDPGFSAFFELDLPGDVSFGFGRFSGTFSTYFYGIGTQRTVAAGQMGPVYAAIQANGSFAVPLNYMDPWPQPAVVANSVAVGIANSYGHAPASGYTAYLAFMFEDTTQGNALRYGWVHIGLSISDVIFIDTGPNVTIYGWAYDNTGLRPAMGAIPEPSSMTLLAFGAMMLGAKGVRNWRRNRPAPGKS